MPTNPQIQDSAGGTFTLAGTTNSSEVFNPAHTISSGGSGNDWSGSNALTVPLGGYTLLATAPANLARAAIEIQNQGATQVQVVIDDGQTGAPTSFLVAGSPQGVGTAGGGWSSMTCKGRVRIYGPAGAPVAMRED